MKITLQLSDEVAEVYSSRLRPNQSLDQILRIQLERFQEIDPRDRVLIVLPPERSRLEELTTRLPLTTIADLIQRVEALAELSIGGIRFLWTPRQYAELKDKAERWRMTPRQYAERIVRQLEEQFFSAAPRPTDNIVEEEEAAPAPQSQPQPQAQPQPPTAASQPHQVQRPAGQSGPPSRRSS